MLGDEAIPGSDGWVVWWHEMGHFAAGFNHMPAVPPFLTFNQATQRNEATVMVAGGDCPSPCTRLTTFESVNRYNIEQVIEYVAFTFEDLSVANCQLSGSRQLI
jgi:hypothetical protein